MANKLYAVSVLALAVAVAPACASKKFVRTEVGNVNTKVDTLSGSLEETQERTRKNEERIGTVDQKAEAAGRSAQDARGAADAAAQSARQVNTRRGSPLHGYAGIQRDVRPGSSDFCMLRNPRTVDHCDGLW